MTGDSEAEDPSSSDSPTVSPRNTLNELTAKEWIPETVSVWRQKGLGAKHPDTAIEKLHPAPFSFTDVSRIIRFFTKPGQLVLDPFVGIGSTLKAAALEGRRGIGIELSQEFADLAKNRIAMEVGNSLFDESDQQVLHGDCRDILPTLTPGSVNLVVTSPPYWNILHKKDHKVRQEREAKGLSTRYSESDSRDLGNVDQYTDFLEELSNIFAEVLHVTAEGGHAAVIVSDFRHGSRLHMFHADLASAMESRGWVLKGITILHQTHKRVFPYGYPTSYVPNIHHQYILILQKPKSPRKKSRDKSGVK